MTDFWTSLYQPSARRTGGTPVEGCEGGLERLGSASVLGWKNTTSAELPRRPWDGYCHLWALIKSASGTALMIQFT